MNKVNFTKATQAVLFKKILQGQLSDGWWENHDTDSRLWSCDVGTSNRPSVNFNPKFRVDFTEIYGEGLDDMMIAAVKTIDKHYNSEKLFADLLEITRVLYGG